MSLPQKKRGFRKIVVDGREFSWRFKRKIQICPASNKDNKLVVDFGWYDGWLYLNDRANTPPDYEPKVVTPEFVRKAIEFALAQGWDVEAKPGITNLIYWDIFLSA